MACIGFNCCNVIHTQIIPSGEEMIPAVMYFANSLYNEPLKKL